MPGPRHDIVDQRLCPGILANKPELGQVDEAVAVAVEHRKQQLVNVLVLVIPADDVHNPSGTHQSQGSPIRSTAQGNKWATLSCVHFALKAKAWNMPPTFPACGTLEYISIW
jgi:hypothetical protein